MTVEKGKFISFEGIDGAGKSTQIENVETFLNQNKIKTLKIREPGGTFLGETLRKLILNQNQNNQFNCQTHALLMYAARIELLEKIIQPALNQNVWVLSDRFFDSTFAYQGGGENLGFDKINQLNQWALNHFEPDLTLFFQIDLKQAQKRIENNRNENSKDHFEKKNPNFFQKVQEMYLFLAKNNPKRIKTINANDDLTFVKNNVLNIIKDFLK